MQSLLWRYVAGEQRILNLDMANVPDYCVDEVSTHAMALILACVRKIPYLSTTVKNGNWDFMVGNPNSKL